MCNQTTAFFSFFSWILHCLVHYLRIFSSHQTVHQARGRSLLRTNHWAVGLVFPLSIEVLWYSRSSFVFRVMSISKRDQCARVCLIKHDPYHSMILCFRPSLVSLKRDVINEQTDEPLFEVCSSTPWNLSKDLLLMISNRILIAIVVPVEFRKCSVCISS